ncbi:hypothetical protein Pcinc_020577 [Petrolisthes cinctipes]|uniref:Sulfatase N-terminal domain-containing protein n=1 Tax=Petrolisthes cinctipes TaxID=88211 RepID=A0AAE1KJS5_PETCI|nr:hypothetical protein Pcinc_020577 [Petrolisthes cinctipes]
MGITSFVLLVLISVVVRTTCSSLPETPQPTSSSSPQPHIVLIVADDLGWHDVSWHNPTVLTPHLERLAKGGVTLEQSYVQPICTPTRSALLTGRYPFTIGRQHGVLWPQEPTGLKLDATLLPQALKQAGYSTHAVGKWHLGFCSWSFTPTSRGFDTFYGYYTGAEDYYNHVRRPSRHHCNTDTDTSTSDDTGWAAKLGYDFRNNTAPDLDAEGTYSTYLFSSYIENLLRSRSAQDPMFLYLPFQSVHAPLQVPDNYTHPYSHIKNHARRIKLGMVTAMDEAVGRVVAALKETGHYNNSIIVFTTDNGGPTVSGGNNWPLRGNKTTLWEGGTRGPAFVHSPLLPHPGRTSNQMVHVTDWFPTLARVGGGTVPHEIDGVDQWKVLRGDESTTRTHMVYNIDNTTSFVGGVRIGNYKLLVGNPGPGDWTPPPEGPSTIPTLLDSIQSSTIPTSIPLHPRSRDHHQNSAFMLEKHDSSSEQTSFTKVTTLKATIMNPDRLTYQEKTDIKVNMKSSPLEKPENPEKLSYHNHRYSENSIFYQSDDITNHSVSGAQQSQILDSQDVNMSYNTKPLSLSGSGEGNLIIQEDPYPDNGSREEHEYFTDSNVTLVTLGINDTQSIVTEFWTKFLEQEDMSNILRISNTPQHHTNSSELSYNITAYDETNNTDVWNSLNGNFNNFWESWFGKKHDPGNGERQGNKKDTVSHGDTGRVAEESERDQAGDTTFKSKNLTDDEQIHQLMMLLGRDTSDIRLYNLAVDAEERHNIAESQKSQVLVLLKYLVLQLPRYFPADIRPNAPAGNPIHYDNIWTPGWCHPSLL